MQGQKYERLKLEQWDRKWNVIIRGIEGTLKEQVRETESKVRGFIKELFHLSPTLAESVIFQAVHRLPGWVEGKRSIIVRFVSLMDRDDVLEAGKKLTRGTGYSVVPDLPPDASRIRSELLNKLRPMPAEEKRRHKLVYIKSFPFVSLKRN